MLYTRRNVVGVADIPTAIRSIGTRAMEASKKADSCKISEVVKYIIAKNGTLGSEACYCRTFASCYILLDHNCNDEGILS